MKGKLEIRRRWSRFRSVLRRLAEVERGKLGLLARTFLLLLFAKIALRIVPVSRIIRWKETTVRGARLQAVTADQLRIVRWAVLVVSRYSPVRFVCFPQCLAGSALLRNMQVPSRLHYGVTREGDKLITHTWLEVEGQILIGGEVADRFSTLAVY